MRTADDPAASAEGPAFWMRRIDGQSAKVLGRLHAGQADAGTTKGSRDNPRT